MARQSKHFEQLHGLVVHVREYNQGAALFRDVDDAEQDGNTDAVDEFGVAEIDYRARAPESSCFLHSRSMRSPVSLFRVVAGVDDGSSADGVRANV